MEGDDVSPHPRPRLRDEIAHRLEATAAAHGDLHMMVLFGSVARGDEDEGSDVDLIIDGPLTEDLAARTLLRGRLIEQLGRSIDLLSVDEGRNAPGVLVGALRDGLVIKGRTGRWPGLLRDRARVEADAREERMTYPSREAAALAQLSQGSRT